MTEQHEESRTGQFVAERKRLLRLAYRYLASVSDAEDAVQEAWIRFSRVEHVENAARLLATIVSRICLDRLKSAQMRRETYVGPWLPEPAPGEVFDTPSDTTLDISFAVMRVLEKLSPAERAAYFLHDLWDVPFEDVAHILSKSPAACRQLAVRARKRLAEERRRFAPTEEQVRETTRIFLSALEDANPDRLITLFAEEAELVSDGGGKVLAALNIIRGPANISRFLAGIASKAVAAGQTLSVEPIGVNDQPALAIFANGELDQAFAFDLDDNGKIATVYIVRNPDKLAPLNESRNIPSTLSR